MKTACTLVLGMSLLPFAVMDEEANKKDLTKMQGDWAAVSMIRDGQRIPDDDAQALFRTVKDDTYAVTRFRKPAGKGTFKIDASKSPRRIDAMPAMPAGAKPLLGIYEWNGEKLRQCLAPPGKDRPREFGAAEGSGHTEIVWEREKK